MQISIVQENCHSGRDLTITVNANDKSTVLCCIRLTTLLLVLLTSHYISQNYSITSFFFQYNSVIIIMCVYTN